MNHIADQEPDSNPLEPRLPLWVTVMVVAAMAAYPLVMFSDQKSSELVVLLSAVAGYGLAVILFYGIPTLVFMDRATMVRVFSLASLAIGFAVSGNSDKMHVLSGWCLIFVTALLTGWMSTRGHGALITYSTGFALIVVISLIAFSSQWGGMMETLSATGGAYVKDFGAMNSNGANTESVARNGERLQQIVDLVVRLLPASTILSTLFQFSIGFLWFSGVTVRNAMGYSGVKPFIHWRVPYGVTILLTAALATRLLGGESAKLAADNALVILSLLYSVGGFALIEYAMRKTGMPRGMKIAGYLLLFLLQFAGFVLTALMGFIDSFVDWRNRPAMNTVDN